MKTLYTFIICGIAMLALTQTTNGQQRGLINVELSGAPFKQLVDAIESQTDYHFYYNPRTTDSLKITLTAQNQNVNTVLGHALAGTQLHFAVDPQGNIFVTEGRDIMTDLPVDFFDTGVAPSQQTLASGFDYTAYEKREKEKKLVESKLYAIGPKSSNLQGNATMAGHVRDVTNGEPLVGATVYIEKPLIGVITDQFGYYAITLPKGRHELKIKSISMKSTVRQIMLYADGKLEIELDPDVTPLKEVVVESDKDVRVMGMQMGMEKLDIKTMKNMPLALGETDIMKVVLALPGVQSVGEGTVGLNVRGGAANQNLILFNDAVVYNPSHLFGFFSTFNPDVLKNVELYKSGITADYGGRLSSVLDVSSREGNLKKFQGSGGISPITGRLTLEGPLIKEKTSFLIGARSTYSDWILRQLHNERLKNSQASFYDVNLNVSHKINDRNNLYLSGYMSHDKFKLNTDTSYAYSDRNASIKWKHIFNNKLYAVATGGISKYSYTMSSDLNPVEAFDMNFSIQQINGKVDFSYFLNAKHTINAGVSVVRYSLQPGHIAPKGEQSTQKTMALQHEQGQENAIYIGDNFEVSPNLSIYGGVRYSFYEYLGPRNVYQYANGVPRSESSITDSLYYGSGKSIASYGGAEPRFSIRYSVSQNASVKFSYNRMRQYIQMLSNTTAMTPTDIWKLSDAYIKPQVGDQVSLGFYKNTRKHSLEISLEAYYKTTQNALDFKGGAVLLLNKHIETDVVDSRGKAYGVEFMLKRAAGKLNGWLSYTYSRSFLQTVSPYASEVVNKGDYYPSNYDKPHAVNFVGNYKFSRRFNFSLNMTYSTGRPITLPLAKYELGGNYRLYYSDRNQYRIPDYFRTDISINIEGNHKIKKLAHSSWTFAVYNLTGRANAYSVFFRSENGQVKGYKLSVFAQPIPTVTYNFKF